MKTKHYFLRAIACAGLSTALLSFAMHAQASPHCPAHEKGDFSLRTDADYLKLASPNTYPVMAIISRAKSARPVKDHLTQKLITDYPVLFRIFILAPDRIYDISAHQTMTIDGHYFDAQLSTIDIKSFEPEGNNFEYNGILAPIKLLDPSPEQASAIWSRLTTVGVLTYQVQQMASRAVFEAYQIGLADKTNPCALIPVKNTAGLGDQDTSTGKFWNTLTPSKKTAYDIVSDYHKRYYSALKAVRPSAQPIHFPEHAFEKSPHYPQRFVYRHLVSGTMLPGARTYAPPSSVQAIPISEQLRIFLMILNQTKTQ